MDFIFIEDMRVEAHVGIYDRERAAPQTLDISLTFGVPDEAAQDDEDRRMRAFEIVLVAVGLEREEFEFGGAGILGLAGLMMALLRPRQTVRVMR